jgi:hypothetical protein
VKAGANVPAFVFVAARRGGYLSNYAQILTLGAVLADLPQFFQVYIGAWQRFGSKFATSLIFDDLSLQNSPGLCKICKRFRASPHSD